MVSNLITSDVPNKFIESLQRRVYQHLDEDIEGDSGSTAKDLTKLIRAVIVFFHHSKIIIIKENKKEEDKKDRIKEIEIDLGVIADSVKGTLSIFIFKKYAYKEQVVEKGEKLHDVEAKSKDLKNWVFSNTTYKMKVTSGGVFSEKI